MARSPAGTRSSRGTVMSVKVRGPARFAAWVVCFGALAAPGARAGGTLGTASDCGGNAYSSAQVTEGRPPRRGPLVAVPDTLCADLDGPRSPVRVEVYGVPGLSGSEGGVGAGAHDAPYEALPRRGLPPSRRRLSTD